MTYTLISGASSGLGYELARIFAEKGSNLILIARQENKLRQIAAELEGNHNIKILVIPQDLSQPAAADKVFNKVRECSIVVDYLVNNAGFYIQGPFRETSWEKELELIHLQCINHTKLVKLLLPEMLEKKEGGILNVCSTGSFMPGPYNDIYCATKSFMLSFSEALAEELAGSGVKITALCPGGMNTSFQDLRRRNHSYFNPLMEAPVVAKSGYHAFMKGKRVFVPGIANKMQVFALRFMPRRFVARLAGMYVQSTKK